MTPDAQTAADAAERVQRWLDEWSFKVQGNLVATGCGRAEPNGCTELAAADIDALLADRARIAAELEQWRAELARNNSSETWLAERNEELRDALIVAAELLKRLSAPGPCDIDGDGACQGHEGFASGYLEPCPHPLGRRFVEAWRTVQSEAQPGERPQDAPEGR